MGKGYIAGALVVLAWIIMAVYGYLTGHSAWPLPLINAGVTALLTAAYGGEDTSSTQ